MILGASTVVTLLMLAVGVNLSLCFEILINVDVIRGHFSTSVIGEAYPSGPDARVCKIDKLKSQLKSQTRCFFAIQHN